MYFSLHVIYVTALATSYLQNQIISTKYNKGLCSIVD